MKSSIAGYSPIALPNDGAAVASNFVPLVHGTNTILPVGVGADVGGVSLIGLTS